MGLHRRSCEERPGTCACAALREHELLVPVIAALAAPSWKRSATCAGRELSGRIEGRERRQALAKAKGCAGGSGQGNGYGEDAGSQGYIRGKGKPAQEALVGHGHQKYRVACINLGGLKKRIRYVYEWNMWNMLADLILCCEVDEVMYEQMTNKVQKWNPANSPEAVQQPPQGFAEELRSIWLGTSSSTAIYVRQVRKKKGNGVASWL